MKISVRQNFSSATIRVRVVRKPVAVRLGPETPAWTQVEEEKK